MQIRQGRRIFRSVCVQPCVRSELANKKEGGAKEDMSPRGSDEECAMVAEFNDGREGPRKILVRKGSAEER